ncbi:hypothetical protein EMPS_03372 [Entomortierella parvispora]|uniref:RING-type domain-containing protein n=1 Tax=Entomortierella parvispora TaxID=205924 RepID=A0A9P3H6N3_9FUNG|nr:hypothetical protein EMPS_03372 [Entomortierella parvispora]
MASVAAWPSQRRAPEIDSSSTHQRQEQEQQQQQPAQTVDPRFLLSPVPASMAQAQAQHTAKGTTVTTTPSVSGDGSTPETITLYPLDPVPSHLLCAICTLPYENPVHFLPCCHVFCLECIQLWIGMNLSDDQLQGELRRAYPSEEEEQDPLSNMAPVSPYGLANSQYQQQFMVELARMGGGDPLSRSRTSTSAGNIYDTFNHLTPTQQRLLQQQQSLQRVAVLLESRDMPKCPMCRTALHIHGWDRLEEQIKVPVSVRSQASRPSGNRGLSASSSSSAWTEQSNTPRQRPVSGVERRRTRTNRFPTSRREGRGESIGEEEEDQEHEDEEIEMEHVRTHRSSRSNALGHRTLYSPPRRAPFINRRTFQHEDSVGNDGDDDDEEEVQSPTTAVIGRRPSEWMRYQQRQLQAHQQQQRQQQSRTQDRSPISGMLSFASLAEDSPHPHTPSANRYDEQQEQIRRLYQEQESQEELLRVLSARATDAGEETTTQEGEVTQLISPTSSTEGRVQISIQELRRSLQLLASQRDHADEQTGPSTENESEAQRTSGGQSLQIDTTLTRSSSRQSQVSQNATNRSRQTTVDASTVQQQDTPRSDDLAGGSRNTADSGSLLNPATTLLSEEEQRVQTEESDGDSIFGEMEQGTRAWAERPSSLVLDLGHNPQSLQLQDISDDHDLSVSDSVSDSTAPSSGSESPSHLISPSNESTLSYQTTSTYQNHQSLGTPVSRRSSSQPHWDLHIQSRPISLSQSQSHSHALQMPSFDAMTAVTEDSESAEEPTVHDYDGYREEPWNDSFQEEEVETNCHKARHSVNECSTSTLEAELARAERNHPSVEKTLEDGNASNTAVDPSTSAGTVGQSSSGSSMASGSSLTAGTLLPSVAWKAGPSGYSPLVRDLDIHTPIITTTEGSVTTLADMQMEADILARARSNSIVFSDEDSPVIREPPSPMDSPIPTPSTARPRNRFPSGFRLIRDDEEDDGNESFNDADGVDEEEEDEMAMESDQEDSAGLTVGVQDSPVEGPETDEEREAVQDEEQDGRRDCQRQLDGDHEQLLLLQSTREVAEDSLADSPSVVVDPSGIHGTEGSPLNESEASTNTPTEVTLDPLQTDGTMSLVSAPTVASISETLTLVTEDPLTSPSASNTTVTASAVTIATEQETFPLRSQLSASPPRRSSLAMTAPPALPMPLLADNPSESNQTAFHQHSEPGSPEVTSQSTRESGEVRDTMIGVSTGHNIGEMEEERNSPREAVLEHTPSSIDSAHSLEESFTENSGSTQGDSIPQQRRRRQDQDAAVVSQEREATEEGREDTLSLAQRRENEQRVRQEHENWAQHSHRHHSDHSHRQQLEQEQEDEERVHVHIQYRTLVRYQPRLPKAHVMSDLISQIRVQCPHVAFGCDETMEMQRALQHGRDHCRFRKVMCPRARCGLWMRADQILEHILMVDPASSSVNASTSSALSPPTSTGSASSQADRTPSTSARSLGPNQNGTFNSARRPSHGLRGRRGSQPLPSSYNNNTRSSPARTTTSTVASVTTPTPSALPTGLGFNSRSNAGGHKEFISSESATAPSAVAPMVVTTTGVPPCPGLTWEREQLTRATGIIGQLTEENSSLRQMIRQLQSQNTRMIKEKIEREKERDRWLRFTSLTSKV